MIHPERPCAHAHPFCCDDCHARRTALRKGATLVLVLVVVLFAMAASGCKTAPPARIPLYCDPLPPCTIPAGATSTQLEVALWSCLLEYRALYSVCYHMQHAAADEATHDAP